jgi:hypothetical protein
VPPAPVNPFFAAEPPQCAAPTADWIVEPRGRSLQRIETARRRSFLPGWRPSSELSNPRSFQNRCQPDQLTSVHSDLDEVILLRSLPQDEQLPVDRVTRTEPHSFVRNATVIHVDAAATNQPSRLAFR